MAVHGDLPSMNTGTYASSTINLDNAGWIVQGIGQGTALGINPLQSTTLDINQLQKAEFHQNPMAQTVHKVHKTIQPVQVIQPQQEMSMAKRLVQVFIADPNENVPLDKSLLYSGQQKLTDATDQELFYELDIKSILDTYNAERVKFLDKKVKERMEYLEPIKVRELKMVVVTIAKFE